MLTRISTIVIVALAILAGLRDVAYPAWSPDGNWIAFGMETETHSGLNI